MMHGCREGRRILVCFDSFYKRNSSKIKVLMTDRRITEEESNEILTDNGGSVLPDAAQPFN